MLLYVTAGNGIVATFLWSGQTVHTDFGLPVDILAPGAGIPVELKKKIQNINNGLIK